MNCKQCKEEITFESVSKESFSLGLCVNCLKEKKQSEKFIPTCQKCGIKREPKLNECWVGVKRYELCLSCLKEASNKSTFSFKSPKERMIESLRKRQHRPLEQMMAERNEKMGITVGKKPEQPFVLSVYFKRDISGLPSYLVGRFVEDIIESKSFPRKDENGNKIGTETQEFIYLETAIASDDPSKPYFKGKVSMNDKYVINTIRATYAPKVPGTSMFHLQGKFIVVAQWNMNDKGDYPETKVWFADTENDLVTLLSGPVDELEGLDIANEINSRLPPGAPKINPWICFFASGEPMGKICTTIEKARAEKRLKDNSDIPF